MLRTELFLLCLNLPSLFGDSLKRDAKFTRWSELDGRTWGHLWMVLFDVKSDSLIQCSILCKSDESCVNYFYYQNNGSCSGSSRLVKEEDIPQFGSEEGSLYFRDVIKIQSGEAYTTSDNADDNGMVTDKLSSPQFSATISSTTMSPHTLTETISNTPLPLHTQTETIPTTSMSLYTPPETISNTQLPTYTKTETIPSTPMSSSNDGKGTPQPTEGIMEPSLHEEEQQKYDVIKETLVFEAAQRKCKEMGGHLAWIGSEGENDEILKLMQAERLTSVFIGHVFNKTDGKFYYIQSEEVVEYMAPFDSDYEVEGDCLVLLNNDGRWIAGSCKQSLPSVCEF